MTWTPATFVAAYPEFAPTLAADTSGSRTVVQTALANAASQCDARLFPDNLDQMVGLMAAHILSIGPYGQQARQSTGDKKKPDESTTYLTEWKRLAAQRAGGPWTMGQPAVAPTILPGWSPWGCP